MNDLSFDKEVTAWREMTGIERSYRPCIGGNLHMRTYGQGPTVMVLHDLPGTGRLLDAVIAALGAAKFRVVAPDIPGFGLSDPISDPAIILAQIAAEEAALAVISQGASAAIADHMAQINPRLRHIAALPGHASSIKVPIIDEDGLHLDRLWADIQRVFGADTPGLQKIFAECLLTSKAGWQMAHDYRDYQPKAPLVSTIAEAINKLEDYASTYVLTEKFFCPGPFGPLHLRRARPARPTADGRRPLVCLHASPLSGIIYAPLLNIMGRTRLVIAPDTPGFGESNAPPRAQEIPDLARALFSVLDPLIDGPFDLFGFHTGSMIAAELGGLYPDRIARIAMISAPLFTYEELSWFKTHYQHKPELADGAHNRERWLKFRDWRGPSQSWENYARNHAQGLRGGPSHFWGHRAAFNHNFADRLKALDQPILIFNPGDDLASHTRRATDLMRRGNIIELGHLGHGMLDSNSDLIAEHLTAFLDAP